MQAAPVNFIAELEHVVRGEPTTISPRALLFVAAEVILEGRKADQRELEHRVRTRTASRKVLPFRIRALESAQLG